VLCLDATSPRQLWEGEIMKRLLISILGVAMLALATAAVASATATFNPFNGVGFIGRGDVIGSIGKDALQRQTLVVSWSGQRFETWDCSFSDGSTQRTTVQFSGFWLMLAQQRVNPNGVVTGYQTPGVPLDSGFFYAGGQFPCSSVTPAGTTLTAESVVSYGDWDAHMSITAVGIGSAEIPVTTAGGWGP
jgi:hypothetical protein